MKLRKHCLLFFMIAFLLLTSCTLNDAVRDDTTMLDDYTYSENIVDTIETSSLDQSGVTEYIYSDTNVDLSDHVDPSSTDSKINSSPSMEQSAVQYFSSIRAMIKELESNSKSENQFSYNNSSIDSSTLRELHGLDDSYSETWVEWSGGLDYYIIYTKGFSTVAFMPFISEEELQVAMIDWLSISGTYESLKNNVRITNINKKSLVSTLGYAYECSYDTSMVEGLKLRYHEYTDPSSNITYILSETLNPDGSLQTNDLFVFDGENSFMCNCADPDITIPVATELSSVVIS